MTLYIIHGWTYTIEPWKKTVTLLRGSGVKVKMLKVPGLTEPSRKVWTMADYEKWADEQIPDGAIALGHSNGGRILLNLAAGNAEKLKHLILLDSAGVYEPSKKKELVRKMAKIGAPLKKNKLVSKVFHKLVGASDYDRAPENMKETLTNMLESDKELDLGKVGTPTTILWGKADTITPPRQAMKMYEQIKGSKLEMFDGWTHAPYISHPEELAKAILKNLREIERK